MFGLVDIAYAASEAAAEGGAVATLGLDWRLFVGQLVNFLVIFFVLWKFVFKPLSKVLQKRQKMIETSVEHAKTLEVKMKEMQVEYQQTIDRAKKEAIGVVDEARHLAEQKAQAIITEAKGEVAKVVTQGKATLQIERDAMIEQARKSVIDLVVASTEKILTGVVDEKVNQSWLKTQLNRIKH
ncbi:MAG: F0F1 ATP synthase subunit B [Parcubacteria group bacterium]|nr:F0F1 ATP synthase subunit B [Parcubacteria group bacterium]